MKKIGIYCMLICLLMTFFVQPTAAESEIADLSVTSGCHTIEAQAPVLGTGQLITNAESVLLYEANSDTLMYAWNADAQMYPASFVKIMTALIAIEKGNMEDIITVRKDILDALPGNIVTVQLLENEVLTLEQLLYCMLVSSANDAAAVIADHIGGSQAAFVAEMNKYAQELGCTGTQFVDAHGLSSNGQFTTARDTARILAHAMKNEQFREIFGTIRYSVDATNKSYARHLSTSNFLMNREDVEIYHDSRVIGGRTGVTDSGDRCIAAVAEKDGLQLISIVMGAKSEYELDGNKIKSFGGFPETSALLDKGFDNFRVSRIIYSNQAIKQQPVANGDCQVALSPQISVSTVLPADCTLDDLTYRYTDIPGLQAPIEKGARLSTLEIWYEDLCVAQADLFALNKVEIQQTQSQDAAVGENSGSWKTALLIIGTVAAVIVALVLGVRITAQVRHAAAANRSRRHRRNRRRSR